MSQNDWLAIVLTLKLAGLTTVILLVIGTPLAWWLANTRVRFKPILEAIIALPLVLPPTVLGFYLLIAFAPNSAVAQFWQYLTGDTLAFSFSALVIASVLYSLPFVVQPLQSGFQQLSKPLIETAASLGAGPADRFFSVILPLCRSNFLVASTLGFAHTVGEFGVVLMIGGNIPGQTQVLSIALYERVESLQYDTAHWLAGGLIAFSLLVLSFVYLVNGYRGLTSLPNNSEAPK
ncbi:molybdate ABC transporter permease subunit [Zhongshania aliphaticivorans]|uniref:molybdate ABC transporter permease subunit n=1 Tax=Zhongshania aliphaticivorans TaxID=1470434 RepID=UPI0012E6957C|nr:molybdate ABC transporter permease subunit [Zhongshania aliphaticivorans]CAA0097629.1 Molybdenum transport system permease protein ModB [Zhongshania aliphaticivorans]